MSCRHHVALGYTPYLFVALVASYYEVTPTNGSSSSNSTLGTTFASTTLLETTTEVSTTSATPTTPPNPPTGLTSISKNSSAIELKWDAVPNVDGYRIIWRALNETSDNKSVNVKEENVTEYSTIINDLRAWTLYKFYVVATKDGLTSLPAITENRTHPDAPCPPSSITLTQINDTNTDPIVLVEWTKPNCTNGPLDGYQISWMNKNSNENDTHMVNGTSEKIISNLQPWTEYEFSIIAYNEFLGKRLESQAVNDSLRTYPSAPCQPGSVNLSQSNVTNANPVVLVEWTKPNCTNGPLSGYQISWTNESSNEENKRIVNATSTKISNLQPWTEYNFSVIAYNDFRDERLESQGVIRSFRTNPSKPGIPTIVALNYSEDSMLAKWLPPDPPNGIIAGYNVRLKEEYCRHNQSSEGWQEINETEYSETNLFPATDYSFSVYAFIKWDGNVLFGEKDCQDFRTDDDYPSVPSNVSCTGINSTAISVSWDEPVPMRGQILNYTVYCKRINPSSKLQVSTSSKTVVLEHLEPYTKYSFRVSAWTSKGEGNLSNSLYCNTTVAAPCPPGNITSRQINNFSAAPIVSVNWTEPSCKNGPLDGYRIYWKEKSNENVTSRNASKSSFEIGNLQPWTEYVASVRAYNEFRDENLESEAVNIYFRTDPSEPGPPVNLTLTPSEQTVHAKWLPSNPTNGIIAGYNISLADEYCEFNQSTRKWVPTNETEYFIEDLHEATNYSFSVFAFIKYEERVLIGPVECRDFITDDGHPSSPSNLMCTGESSASLNISWDEPTEMRGEILNYTVVYWETNPLGNHSIRVTPERTLTLDQLEPYTQYGIKVSAWTSKGQGNWSAPVTCRTYSAVPNTPSEVSIDVLEPTTIFVAWKHSEPYPGPIKYRVITENLRDHCDETPEGKRSNVTTKNNNIKITDLSPFTEYSTIIIAETDAGSSKPTSKIKKWTLPSEPNAVQKLELNCNINSSIASISWSPPSRPNGILQSYLIEYTGTKAGKKDDKKDRRVLIEDECSSDEVVLTIDGLLPEYKYSFKVAAKVEGVESYGQSVTKHCSLPAGFPPPPQKNISVLERLKKEIIFVLQQDTFLDTEGDIIEYAVLVADAKNIGTNESGGRNSERLPNWSEFQRNGSVLRYQATPEDWNPFMPIETTEDDPLKCERGSKNVTCTLGCQLECDANSYCNGPLKPGMSYGFKIRGYTRTGFAETLPVMIYTKSEPTSNAGNVITAVIVSIVIVSVLATGVFLYRRYGAARAHQLILRLSSRRFVKSTVMATAASPTPNEIVSFTPNVTHTRPVKLSEFSKHVSFMMSDSALKFSQEFEELKSISPSHPCTAAQLPDNRPKNRWINILPFDHSRVKLLPVDDEPASDYINGSYIPGFTCHREYIATQGPLPGTVDDMWRMIWEQGVNMIVMLTQCVERGKIKCEQYWPAEKQTATYGDLQVQTMCESVLSEYTIRTFDLSLGSRHRVITHLHFTKWPDFGCPDNTELLINFVRAVRDHMSEDDPNPLLVHCSAGVGRTGTFIAVDRLMQHILIHGFADIFQSVLDMREHRTNMVQTEDQYIYIHECVRDLVQDKLARERDSLKDDEIYGNIGVNSTTKV